MYKYHYGLVWVFIEKSGKLPVFGGYGGKKMAKILLTATVQSHIAQFHKPLIRMLQDMGHRVEVAAKYNLNEKKNLTLTEPDAIHEVAFCRSPFSFQIFPAYRQLKALIEKEQYDIVHCNTPVAGILTRLACRKLRKAGKVKVIYTAHGFHFYKGAPKKNWIMWYSIEKVFSRMTDVLITITEEDYRLASEKFSCRVVHHHGVGANSAKFYPMEQSVCAAFREECGIPPETKVIMNIGELLPNKNQKTAIDAMKQIVSQYPDSILLIAGNGPEEAALKLRVEENGLSRHIRFLGYTREVHKYLNICDVLVACSFREGLPLNLMEAMLCGKPIVASDNRGHRELVTIGKTGYLVPPADSHAFAEMICKVLKDASDYKGEALRKVQPFTDKSVQNEQKALYQTLLM